MLRSPLTRYIGGIGHLLRHVRLVAFFAVGDNHFSRVRLVTLRALRDLAVDVMTDGAVKGGMLALIVPELSDLLRVTGEAGIRYIVPAKEIFNGVCGFL